MALPQRFSRFAADHAGGESTGLRCRHQGESNLSNPDITSRLETCFWSVFSDLSPEQIRAARADQIAEWDSMATVTLRAVVNEEFGLDLDLAQMEPLLSFAAMRSELETRLTNG